MTIISPKKNKAHMSPLLIGLILLLIAGACWNIFAYNQIVNFNHTLNVAEEQLIELKADNAEIKNQLYQLTSADNLIKLGMERGLVETSSPRYVKINDLWSAAFVSQ